MKKITLLFTFTLLITTLHSQQWQWAKSIVLPYGNYVSGGQLRSGPSGNFYVSCYKWDSNYGLPAGSCIIKFDKTGNELWRKFLKDGVRVYRMRIDAFENILLAGDFKDSISINGTPYKSSAFNDGFVLSLDSAGNTNWFRQLKGLKDECGSDIEFDRNGNLLLTGGFSDNSIIGTDTLHTNGISGSYICRFDRYGNLLQHITTNAADSSGRNAGQQVREDSLGNLYLMGSYNQVKIDTTTLTNGNPYNAQYLAKFDSAGKPVFLNFLVNGTTYFRKFSLIRSALYFTGDGGWTTGGWTSTKKWNLSGNEEWWNGHGGFYYGYSSNSMAPSSKGFYAIGYEENPNVPLWQPTYSLLLSEFDSNGTENCTRIKSGSAAVGLDIERTNANEYIILSTMPDTITLGSITLIGTNQTAFIAKFKEGQLVTNTEEPLALSDNNILIFPNPTAGQFSLKLKEAGEGNICVYDALGNCVSSSPLRSASTTVDLSGQAKGLYFVQVNTLKERFVKKLVLN